MMSMTFARASHPAAGLSGRPPLWMSAALGRICTLAVCLAISWGPALASGPELESAQSHSRAAHAGPPPVIGRAGGNRVCGPGSGGLCRGGVLSAGNRSRHHCSRRVRVQRALHHAHPGTKAQGSGAIQRDRGNRAVHLDRRARCRLDPDQGLPAPQWLRGGGLHVEYSSQRYLQISTLGCAKANPCLVRPGSSAKAPRSFAIPTPATSSEGSARPGSTYPPRCI